MSFRRFPGIGEDALRAFTLLEVMVATTILAVAFLGLFGTAVQAGKLASAAEEEALVMCALEQRVDELRLLEWPDLTSGNGIGSRLWTAPPAAVSVLPIRQETISIRAVDLPGAESVLAIWKDSEKTLDVITGTVLSAANAVEVSATLTWTGRRSGRTQTRSLVTIIARGGLSKSDRP